MKKINQITFFILVFSASFNSIYGQSTQLEVDGHIKLTATDPGISYTPGTIRWSGNDFMGWNGVNWVSLTGDKSVGKVTDIDGNQYKTIRIGDYLWMTENLRTTRYRDGSVIFSVTSATTWAGTSAGAYTHYDNNMSYNEDLGKLYNWHAVKTNQLCPVGWFVPNDNHWNYLDDYVGINGGGKLKARATSYWFTPNDGANNESGFTAIGAGIRRNDGGFQGINVDASFWSSTDLTSLSAGTMTLHYFSDGVSTGVNHKNNGLAVRCIKPAN